MSQRQTNHGAIVNVRVKLVIKLEVPAAGLSLRIFHFPIPDRPHLPLQNPIGAPDHAGIIARHSALTERKHCVCRVPHGRHARLHAESVFFLDAEFFEFVERSDHLGIVHRIPETAKCDDGVQHGGVDCAQAIAHFEVRQHPLLRLLERDEPQRTNVHPLEPVRHAIQ